MTLDINKIAEERFDGFVMGLDLFVFDWVDASEEDREKGLREVSKVYALEYNKKGPERIDPELLVNATIEQYRKTNRKN